MRRYAAAALLLVGLTSCHRAGTAIEPSADARGHIAPSAFTTAANRDLSRQLPLAAQADFEDARRGLIAGDGPVVVTGADGRVVWDTRAYDFVQGASPDSVNPSLWRQASLNNIHGLFKVTDRVYQVRGYDLSNMSVIEGDSGWIVVDPLTAGETAARAMSLVRENLGDKPVVAVVFTHSHIDHFGGVAAVMPEDDTQRAGVRVIAPVGFMAEATSENIIAGMAMGRRSAYMYGKNLARSPRGHVGSGLGKGPAFGHVGLAQPTEIITATGQRKVIDGVEFVFQNAAGSEAPAELTFALPQLHAYCGAEVATRNLHNLYTLRGAKVRDSLQWSEYIDQMIDLSAGADVYFISHHWPVWGRKNIRAFLERQRDTYKYIHDQSVRLFNAGATPREIAEQMVLPATLSGSFSNRDYYGTLKHNSKAVYQAYLGWYDGNPANLDRLPPKQLGEHYVELAGGAQALRAKAREAYDKGEYRWVAELLNHLVFADASDDAARSLLADTYDQLAYRAESGPWRDEYLTAADELRHGNTGEGIDIATMAGVLEHTPVDKFFQSMAVRLNGPSADGVDMSVVVQFSDLQQSYLLSVKNAVLHHRMLNAPVSADATLTLTHPLFIRMLIGAIGLRETLTSDDLAVDGSVLDLLSFFSLFDRPKGTFDIVTP